MPSSAAKGSLHMIPQACMFDLKLYAHAVIAEGFGKGLFFPISSLSKAHICLTKLCKYTDEQRKTKSSSMCVQMRPGSWWAHRRAQRQLHPPRLRVLSMT